MRFIYLDAMCIPFDGENYVLVGSPDKALEINCR